MKDLVSIMEDEEAMLKMGFKMKSDDEQIERDVGCARVGLSQYTRIVSSSNPGYILGRKI